MVIQRDVMKRYTLARVDFTWPGLPPVLAMVAVLLEATWCGSRSPPSTGRVAVGCARVRMPGSRRSPLPL